MKERIKSIDSLRGLAILAVLLIHTTTRTLEASHFDVVNFSWTLFLNQASRFSVPLFILISGFVLELNVREESYWSFIKRRISKIIIPYIIWSIIYYLFVYNNNHDNFAKVIITGDASYQLYFIPALIVFYLTFPIIHKLCNKVSNKILFILVIAFEMILLYQNYFIKAFDFGDHVNAIILGYAYFVLGVIISRNKDILDKISVKFNKLIPVLTALGGLYIFWEGRSRYLITGNYLAYYSQWRPSVLIYTLFVGLTCYFLFENTKFKGSIVVRFAKHSFFVFFIHVATLEIVWHIFGNKLFNLIGTGIAGQILFDPIFYCIVALTSFFVALLLHKIPKSAKLLG